MTNLERYNNIFKSEFGIDDSQLEELVYRGIPEWDSVGHMSLIANLEDEFGIMMEMEDIIDFSSYVMGIEIMERYGVSIN